MKVGVDFCPAVRLFDVQRIRASNIVHFCYMKFQIVLALLSISLASSAQEYQQEEITFTNEDITLSGTLSFPDKKTRKYPAIVLLSGSGPQNRDSEIFGFKPFKILADFFNSQGYAVLRFDDRGVGKSTGKGVMESTSKDLAADGLAAVNYLIERDDIDAKRVGVLGHSEGGILAPIIAVEQPKTAFIILMAGYGVPGVELTNAQLAAIQRSSGFDEVYIEAAGIMNNKVIEKMFDEKVSDEELEAFTKSETLKLLELLPDAMKAQITDSEAYAQMSANQVLGQAKIPWIKYYMGYDPMPVLKQVKCPVMLLFGELDTQVTADQNKELMHEALKNAGNSSVYSVTIPKANHMFQEAVTGSPNEYATLKKEFAPGFLEEIGKWLSQLK